MNPANTKARRKWELEIVNRRGIMKNLFIIAALVFSVQIFAATSSTGEGTQQECSKLKHLDRDLTVATVKDVNESEEVSKTNSVEA